MIIDESVDLFFESVVGYIRYLGNILSSVSNCPIMSKPLLLVLSGNLFGHPGEDYASLLRNRLPDWEVRYPESRAGEQELLERATVVTGAFLDPEHLDETTNPELFAYAFSGTDHLPLEEYEAHDIAVTSASGVPAPNIAEHVIGSLVAGARDFQRAWRQQEAGVYRSFHTKDIANSTVSVIGLGAIGTAVVKRLEGFDVDTIGVRYTPEKGGPTDSVLGYDELEAAIRPADFVVLTCPLTDETEGLIDDTALGLMDPDAVLVNVARGEVVETEALTRRMQRNHLGYAVLDVTDPEPLPADHPLWQLDNVFITPHYAGETPSYLDRLSELVADNATGLEEGELTNQIV